MKRRKSSRPAKVVPPSPPVDQLNVNENTTTEPTSVPEGRKINARKTRSESGPSEPPKNVSIFQRQKLMEIKVPK